MKWNGSLTSSCTICGWRSKEVHVPFRPSRFVTGTVIWWISSMYDLHYLRRHLLAEARRLRGENE